MGFSFRYVISWFAITSGVAVWSDSGNLTVSGCSVTALLVGWGVGELLLLVVMGISNGLGVSCFGW